MLYSAHRAVGAIFLRLSILRMLAGAVNTQIPLRNRMTSVSAQNYIVTVTRRYDDLDAACGDRGSQKVTFPALPALTLSTCDSANVDKMLFGPATPALKPGKLIASPSALFMPFPSFAAIFAFLSSLVILRGLFLFSPVVCSLGASIESDEQVMSCE